MDNDASARTPVADSETVSGFQVGIVIVGISILLPHTNTGERQGRRLCCLSGRGNFDGYSTEQEVFYSGTGTCC